jgi:hypothetical protein
VRLGVGSSILGFCLTFKPSGKPEVRFMEDYVLSLRKVYMSFSDRPTSSAFDRPYTTEGFRQAFVQGCK